MASKNIIWLQVLPENLELVVKSNQTVAQALIQSGIELHLPCSGAGICGNCKIKFLKGAPPISLPEESLLSQEEILQGVRLACLALLKEDSIVEIPEALRLSSLVSQGILQQSRTSLKPIIRKIYLDLPLDRLQQENSDWDLVSHFLHLKIGKSNVQVLPEALTKLPSALREKRGKMTVTLFERTVLDVEAGDTRSANYALAIDLGTTTVGVLLLDLNTGQTLDYALFANPQAAHGSDLISRIAYAAQNFEHCQRLRELLHQKLVEVIEQLCLQHQISPTNIYAVGIAGNTVMTQLFWGISPKHVGSFPFKPTASHSILRFFLPLHATQMVLPLVFSFPLIGGFVGGDVLADLVTARVTSRKQPKSVLLIDIGTNCEVVLKTSQGMWAASAPAGPALEGANISQGMRALPGALIDLQRSGQTIHWQSIDDQPPVGICGSGLFHILHFLLDQGVITPDGQIVTEPKDPFWKARIYLSQGNQPVKILLVSTAEGAARDLFLTQQDIRQFQLANAAISSAWQLLCKQNGVVPQQLDQVFIAGTFGNFIRPLTLKRLGTVPHLPLNRIQFLGNAALEGVRLALLNRRKLVEVRRLGKTIRFCELASNPEFQEVFVEHLKLKSRVS